MSLPSNVGKASLRDYNEPNLVITFVCLTFNLRQTAKFDSCFTWFYDYMKYVCMWISCAVSCRATEHCQMSGGSGLYLSDSSYKGSNDLLLEGFRTLICKTPSTSEGLVLITDSILPELMPY